MGKFSSDSGGIGIRHVLHCSSEDGEHPAINILSKLNKTWRCSRKEAGTGRASITLELESPTYIQTIEIVNAGSAFVQVDGMVNEDSSTVPLLPMRQIMSEQDCASSNVSVSYTSSHLFKRAEFAAESFRRFRFLVVTVMQPYRLGYPFGIGSLTVTKPCYADKIRNPTPGLSDPNEEQEIEFSFMKQSPKKQPLRERIFGLNDAVNDENFEMKKSAPMNRLGMKTQEKQKTPKRNSYFAALNEQHGFVYKTPRASKKSGSSKTLTSESVDLSNEAEGKENVEVDNKKSFYGDQVTPSRKRKKGKLNIVDSTGAKHVKKRSLDQKAKDRLSGDEDDLPEFTLTVSSDPEPSPPPSPSSRSPAILSVSPGRCNFTKSPDLSEFKRNITEKSPKSTKRKAGAPRRVDTRLSWIGNSFGNDLASGSSSKSKNKTVTSSSKIKSSPRADSSEKKSKSTSRPDKGRTPSRQSPSVPKNKTTTEKSPSTSRWNSTVSGRSPKFISIMNIEEETHSPKRNRKLSDNPGLIIIDDRSPGTRTQGTSRKFTPDRSPGRINISNPNTSSTRGNDDSDDVLVCRPLSTAARKSIGKVSNTVQEIELVPCPMCGDKFLPSVIETHANNCIDTLG